MLNSARLVEQQEQGKRLPDLGMTKLGIDVQAWNAEHLPYWGT